MTLQGIRNVFQQYPLCWHSFVGLLCFVLVLYIDTRKIFYLIKILSPIMNTFNTNRIKALHHVLSILSDLIKWPSSALCKFTSHSLYADA